MDIHKLLPTNALKIMTFCIYYYRNYFTLHLPYSELQNKEAIIPV